MAFSTRFVVAVHTLVGLGLLEGSTITSERIARSVDTNPTFLRQVVSELRDAGHVTAERGPAGGYRLEGDPSDISLLDVFEAIETDRVLAVPDHEPHSECPIGTTIAGTLRVATSEAETAVRDELAEQTIADLTSGVQSRATDRALRDVISEASD